MSFKPDIPETPLYKSKPMISKDYKKETDVKVGKNFVNKEALDLAIRLKALDEGYQFLNDRSAPKRHAAIALAVQDEFPLAYHDVYCRHLMMNLSLKRDKTKALFWRICKAYTTKEFSRSMSHLQDILTDAKLPVLKLAETYRAMVQEWYYQRRKLTGTCQCRKWQLSGIPCGHVISVTSNPENVRLSVLAKLQETLDEEDILADQILTMMHRYADRFTNRRVEINNLMVLQDHPLVDYGKYAFGFKTGADIKKCVHLKSVRDELLRSMEEKRQLMTNYKDM
nr:hypothetical protein [Tanacetum cinerariifolium]